MNSTASNKKFTTDFNKGSIKSKVIGGVGSFGRVKWKVVSIALQQPFKTSLEMSCCACWGRVLVCCAVGELCALQIPPYSLDGFSVLTYASLLILTARQTHTLVSLCPPKYLISVLTHNNTTYVSTDRFEIQVMGKKTYAVIRMWGCILNLYFPEKKLFLPLSSLGSSQAEGTTRQPELIKFSWRIGIWNVST